MLDANPTHNIRALLYRITRNSLGCLYTSELLPIPHLIITAVDRLSTDLGACQAWANCQNGEQSL